ncbi:MAG: hypothetical protein P4L51_09975 [Puia sp.]|nr:hypothetical protein [Puia sp.]
MRKITLLTFSIFSIYLFSSCIARNMTFGNGKDWIPADFDAKNTILLIETNDPMKQADKKMLAYMREKYPYRFECVSHKTIMDKEGKYADVSLYRYSLINTYYTINSMTFGRPSVGAQDFCFYDRSNGKKYPSTGKGSSGKVMTFKPVINTIVKNVK